MPMKQKWGVFVGAGVLLSLALAACASFVEPAQQVLYFTHRTDADPGLLAPAHWRRALGAQSSGEWGDVMRLHGAQPAAAILIDGAAAEYASEEDLARLYQQCVALVFFNLYAPQVASLVNVPGLSAQGWMDGSDSYPGDFYILLHRQPSGAQGDCSGAGPSGSPGAAGSVSQSRAQGPLTSQAEIDVLQQVLMLAIAPPQ